MTPECFACAGNLMKFPPRDKQKTASLENYLCFNDAKLSWYGIEKKGGLKFFVTAIFQILIAPYGQRQENLLISLDLLEQRPCLDVALEQHGAPPTSERPGASPCPIAPALARIPLHLIQEQFRLGQRGPAFLWKKLDPALFAAEENMRLEPELQAVLITKACRLETNEHRAELSSTGQRHR